MFRWSSGAGSCCAEQSCPLGGANGWFGLQAQPGPAEYFYGRCLHVDPRFASPPGYVTEATQRAGIESQIKMAPEGKACGPATGPARLASLARDMKGIVDNGYVIVGSPDEVVEQQHELATTLNIGELMLMMQFGNLPTETVKYNTRLFAEKVMPKLRPLFSEWENRWKVKRLALIAPFGLYDEKQPPADPWAQRADNIPALMTAQPEVYKALKEAPAGANSVEWPIEQTRAAEAAARIFWPLGDTRLKRRLPLIKGPTGRIMRLVFCSLVFISASLASLLADTQRR